MTNGFYGTYSLGHQWIFSRHDSRWRETPIVLGAQAPQVLFLELCVRRLKPGGRLAIVLPEGVFGNKGDAYIWHWLQSQGAIYAMLDCPRTMFQPGTDTKTNVLFFRRGGKGTPCSTAQKVRVAVAVRCGHDRRGRTHLSDGSPQPNDLPELAQEFHRSSKSGPWRDVAVDPNLYGSTLLRQGDHPLERWGRADARGQSCIPRGVG